MRSGGPSAVQGGHLEPASFTRVQGNRRTWRSSSATRMRRDGFSIPTPDTKTDIRVWAMRQFWRQLRRRPDILPAGRHVVQNGFR